MPLSQNVITQEQLQSIRDVGAPVMSSEQEAVVRSTALCVSFATLLGKSN